MSTLTIKLRYFQIYSRPLAQCLEEILASNSGNDVQSSVSTELCNIVRDHFAENTTVGGVAQSVVDKIVRMHRENFEQTGAAAANLVCGLKLCPNMDNFP